MDRFRGQIVTRLLAGIAFGVLFLAGGFYFVGKFLTHDLMIRQQLPFKIPESRQEQFSTGWAAFAREQQVQLLQLAKEKLPYLARYVSVIPQTKNPIITLRLRCPPDADEKIPQKFNELVEAYTDYRNAMQQSEVISSSDAVFHAQLDLSEDNIARSYPFSRFQQFVLVVFAFAGFLLGIGPPGGYLHDNEQEPEKTPREICRSITSASSELAVLSSTTFDTTTATQTVVTIPKKKTHREPEQTVLPVVERITVDEAGTATERNEPKPGEFDTPEKLETPQDIEPPPTKKPKPEPEPKPKPKVDEVVKPPTPVVHEKPGQEKIETIPLAQPEENDIIEAEQPEAEPLWQNNKIIEAIPEEPAETAQETQSVEIPDEDSESIFEEKEIPVEKPAATMDEEEIENHSRQQEVLLSEIMIPKKKKDIDSNENIANEPAKAAIEPEPEPESEPEPVEPVPDTTKVEPVSPSKPQPEPSPEPVPSESEESMVAPEQESIPVVAIDLNKDMPSAQAAGTNGTARSKYDTLADLIEKLRPQVRCPVIAVSALKPKDVSPRLTVNLAVTLIRRALRVLIVEADPSNKELATLFGLPEEPGFFEWRRGAAWISHTTHRTQLVGLSVMPAGIPNEPQKNPDLELWREKHRWGNLSNDFDVVLLYHPSALVVQPQSPEQIMGVHLRNMAHGVLALTRSTKQIEKSAQTVVDNLAEYNAQLLAIVPIKT